MTAPKFSILFILSFLFVQNLYCQQDSNTFTPRKNVVHASIGTFVAGFSAHLSYDRLLASKNGFFKSYYASAKVGGITAIDFSGTGGGTGSTLSLGVTGLTGSNERHLEVGLGLGYYIDSIIPENDTDESGLFPHFAIGYRLQKSTGFMFRTGIGITEWAYVGFGYSF